MIPYPYTETNPLHYDGQALFLVEGTLSELQTAPTTVNLLAQIDSHVKAKSLVAGGAAALGGLHGVVANSAALALYDGEDACHFAGLLNGQVLCGTFRHAENIKDGDKVNAVVSKRGEVLFAHAIMNAKTQEFYMPLNVFFGSSGLFEHCMKVAFWFSVLGWVVLFSTFAFSGFLFDSEVPGSKRLTVLMMCLFLPPLIAYPLEYWTYRTMGGGQKDEGDSYAAAIFKVFDFPKPNKIDLMRHSDLSEGKEGGWYAAWRADILRAKLKA